MVERASRIEQRGFFLSNKREYRVLEFCCRYSRLLTPLSLNVQNAQEMERIQKQSKGEPVEYSGFARYSNKRLYKITDPCGIKGDNRKRQTRGSNGSCCVALVENL